MSVLIFKALIGGVHYDPKKGDKKCKIKKVTWE
jgi:hypothetical protein